MSNSCYRRQETQEEQVHFDNFRFPKAHERNEPGAAGRCLRRRPSTHQGGLGFTTKNTWLYSLGRLLSVLSVGLLFWFLSFSSEFQKLRAALLWHLERAVLVFTALPKKKKILPGFERARGP